MSESKSVIIKSLDRALDILELLHLNGDEMSVTEIAKEMCEYPSTIFRALVTLNEKGFIYQNHENNKYGLGIKLYSIGIGIKNKIATVRIVESYAKELCNKMGETVNISIRDYTNVDNYYCVLIHQELSKGKVIGTSQMVGESTLGYYSAVGKILIAYAQDYNDKIIEKTKLTQHTQQSIIDNEEMKNELKNIKKLGYAFDNEEIENGLFCIACPVLNNNGYAEMAISISGPKHRMMDIGIENIVSTLKSYTTIIQKYYI